MSSISGLSTFLRGSHLGGPSDLERGINLLLRRGVRRDLSQAIELIKDAADAGNPAAQFYIGFFCDEKKKENIFYITYEEDIDADILRCLCDQDFSISYGDEPAEWYKKAADQGHPGAQCALGLTYKLTYGATREYNEAIELFQKSAEKYHAGAQFKLGQICKRTSTEEEALQWYEVAAAQGHAPAQDSLALCLERKKTERDDLQAAALYQKAAAKGFAPAQCNLADFQSWGRGGLRRNEDQEFALYRKAAEQGYAHGQFKLGERLLSKGEWEQGATWLRRAAEQDDANAQYTLGWNYCLREFKIIGVKESFLWIERAAKQSHCGALVHLGLLHLGGTVVPQDIKEAIRCFRLATLQGSSEAFYELGCIYERGSGGKAVDIQAAIHCYEEAVKIGAGSSTFAANALERLRASMNP